MSTPERLTLLEKLLTAFQTPRSVDGLSRDLRGEATEVKTLLYSLRALGVLATLHGDGSNQVCVIDPDGVAALIEALREPTAAAQKHIEATRQRIRELDDQL
jgi:hypothetical protein